VKINNLKYAWITVCGIFLVVLFCPFTLGAQSKFHFSATTGYEVTQGYAPGFDFTLLYNNRWGIRYSIIPGVQMSEKAEVSSGTDFVSTHNLKGNLEFPMLLRTIDYRSFGKQNAIPFDFLTAYSGIGYSIFTAELIENRYKINDNSLIQTVSKRNIDVPTSFFVFGIYGGERFIVIDGKLLYFRGIADQKQTGSNYFEFDHWLIQISAGIGF